MSNERAGPDDFIMLELLALSATDLTLAIPREISQESIFCISAFLHFWPLFIPSKMTATVDFPYSVNDGKLS